MKESILGGGTEIKGTDQPKRSDIPAVYPGTGGQKTQKTGVPGYRDVLTIWTQRQAERAGFPKRHPDQEAKKRREISAGIAMALAAPPSQFDGMREVVYSLMREECLAAGHNGVCFTSEAKTLRNAPSLKDQGVKTRLVTSAQYLLRTLAETGEIDWPAVDAQMRMLNYLTARPWCEVSDGQVHRVELPKRKAQE